MYFEIDIYTVHIIKYLRGRERGVEDGEMVLEAEVQRRQLGLGEGHDVASRHLSKNIDISSYRYCRYCRYRT